jgi:hypothetical protein
MQSTVCDRIDQFQIVDHIVKFVVVFVVDVPTFRDLSLVATPNDTVFGLVELADTDHAVAIAI